MTGLLADKGWVSVVLANFAGEGCLFPFEDQIARTFPAWRDHKIRGRFFNSLSLALFLCPPHSPAPLLRPIVEIACEWPCLLSPRAKQQLPHWLTGRSGPLGYGASKLAECCVGWALLAASQRQIWPTGLHLGKLPDYKALVAVLGLAGVVNLVLHLWSKHSGENPRGDHKDVHAMVEATRNRSLSVSEHTHLAFLAFLNAVCEEGVSRGFYMHELQTSGQLSVHTANLAQAAAFGLRHFCGIPSGWTGVGLTFVYGLIMGGLKHYGGGLFLPVLSHGIADYYIFAVLARANAS
eukprot:g46098.t1